MALAAVLVGLPVVAIPVGMAPSASASETMLFPGADGAAPHRRDLLLDFEDGRGSNWVISAGDSPYITCELRHEPTFGEGFSLWCHATGLDSTRSSNEQVDVLLPLSEPVLVTAESQISWLWWFRDRDQNDGVGLEIRYRAAGEEEAHWFAWASHSHHDRGAWPFSDPELTPCAHRITIGEALAERVAAGRPEHPFPWLVDAIRLFFWFPTDQILYLDNLRIHPRSGGGSPPVEGAEGRSGRAGGRQQSDSSQHSGASQQRDAAITSVCLGDLNGDGRVDRLFGSQGNPPKVYLGRGDAGDRTDLDQGWRLVSATQHGLGRAISMTFPQLADLDGDGRLDLICVSNDRMQVFRGLGGGFFHEARGLVQPDMSTNRVGRILVADLLGAPSPELYLARVNRLFQCDSIYLAPERLTRLAPERLAQSAPEHLARPTPERLAQPAPANRAAAFLARAFPPQPHDRPRAGFRTAFAAGDLDNDGRPDLVATNFDVFLAAGDSLVCRTRQWLPEAGGSQSGAVLGDIDNDGDLDLIVTVNLRHGPEDGRTTHEHSLVYINAISQGEATFRAEHDRLGEFDSGRLRHPLLVDLDLDGDLDLFALRFSFGTSARPPNLVLLNDGTGRFRPAPWDFWASRARPASSARFIDLDDDGDLDLVCVDAEDGREVVLWSPAAQHGRWVKVRVLDRRGRPHAGGAHLTLRQDGAIVGYRQTGTGELSSGWSEAVFGLPAAEGDGRAADRRLELEVRFPSRFDRPLRRKVSPGQTITLIEPAFAGWMGELWARGDYGARRLAGFAAGAGLLPAVAGGAGLGFLAGAILFGASRRRRMPDDGEAQPRKAQARGAQARGAQPRKAQARGAQPRKAQARGASRRRAVGWLLLILCAAGIAAGLRLSVHWPIHNAARLGLAGAWIGLVGGSGLAYGALARLTARRARSAIPKEVVQRQLLIAIDGFSHARWFEDLTRISSQVRSLQQGAALESVLPVLRQRLDSYERVARPQLLEIDRCLAAGHIPAAIAGSVHQSQTRLHELILWLREWTDRAGAAAESGLSGARHVEDPGLPEPERVEEIAALVDGLQERLREIFSWLAQHFRTDLRTCIQDAAGRVRTRHDFASIEVSLPEALPDVFGIQHYVVNIFENLLSNAVKAARANADQRSPRVAICAKVLGDLVTIEVSDTGPGIPPDAFRRAREAMVTDPEQGGRGLPYAVYWVPKFRGRIHPVPVAGNAGGAVSVTLRALAARQPTQPMRSTHE